MNLKRSAKHLKNHARVIWGNVREHPGEVTRKSLETVAERPITVIGQGPVAIANRGIQINALRHGDFATASACQAASPGLIMTAGEGLMKKTMPGYDKKTKELANKIRNSKRINNSLGTTAGENINLSSRSRLRELVQKGYSEYGKYRIKRFSKL